jgi:hypothetical protein
MFTAHQLHIAVEMVGLAAFAAAAMFAAYTFVGPVFVTLGRAAFVRIAAALVALDAHIRRLEVARAERRAQAASIVKAAP